MFVGRDYELRLLNGLFHCDMFRGKKADPIDAKEKLKLLAVTGGVPRYLEEINPNLPAEENIRRICFNLVSSIKKTSPTL